MLDRLNALWSDCNRCALAKTGRCNVVIGTGPEACPLMIIGEAPGADEDELGEPFVGASGKLLRSEALQAGIRLQDHAFITNIVGCRPPDNRVPMPDEIQACRARLEALVQVVRPTALLLLGGTALMSIAGKSGVAKNRGKWVDTTWTWKGKQRTIPALATFHPAGLLPGRIRDKNELALFRTDIRMAYDRAYGTDSA